MRDIWGDAASEPRCFLHPVSQGTRHGGASLNGFASTIDVWTVPLPGKRLTLTEDVAS
jgi:hypothetical protein